MAEALVSSKFDGHRAPVLSLDYHSDDNLLLSGSEDRTARLWDVRDGKRRACLCIPTQGDVLSVAFSPTNPGNKLMEVDLLNPFAKDHTIFLSVEQMVFEYDLRKATGPIFQQPTRDLSQILQNQDEVNQLALAYFQKPQQSSSKGKRKGKGGGNKSSNKSMPPSSPQLYIAAADDAGTIRFMDSSSSTQSHILHHDSNGVAVVPSCAFRPLSNRGAKGGLELASGGTDCKIHLWDLLKPKRPLSSYTIQQPESGDTNKPQVCNPPMVYSLSWSPSGQLLAAGLGDGNIPIFSIENRNLVQIGYLPDGHDSSVASVVFPAFAGDNERLLCSGGSDGSVLFWDVGSNVMMAEEEASGANSNPSCLFAETLLPDGSLGDTVDEAAAVGKPRILFGIPHASKVNWMTTSRRGSVFVADTSHTITEYVVPLR